MIQILSQGQLPASNAMMLNLELRGDVLSGPGCVAVNGLRSPGTESLFTVEQEYVVASAGADKRRGLRAESNVIATSCCKGQLDFAHFCYP